MFLIKVKATFSSKITFHFVLYAEIFKGLLLVCGYWESILPRKSQLIEDTCQIPILLRPIRLRIRNELHLAFLWWLPRVLARLLLISAEARRNLLKRKVKGFSSHSSTSKAKVKQQGLSVRNTDLPPPAVWSHSQLWAGNIDTLWTLSSHPFFFLLTWWISTVLCLN